MTRLPRYSLYLRLLRLSLVVGAAYDVVLAAGIAFAPDFVARLLRVPLPGAAFYLWLLAFLLVTIAAFYLLAAYDPASYRGNILVAIGARTAAAVLLAAAGRSAGLPGLYVAAAGDFVFAVAHTVFYLPLRR